MDGKKNGGRRGTRNETHVGKRKNEKVKKIMEERSAERPEILVNPGQSFFPPYVTLTVHLSITSVKTNLTHNIFVL
jgi:hypothetical protein